MWDIICIICHITVISVFKIVICNGKTYGSVHSLPITSGKAPTDTNVVIDNNYVVILSIVYIHSIFDFNLLQYTYLIGFIVTIYCI
jgi:hypothetical protein